MSDEKPPGENRPALENPLHYATQPWYLRVPFASYKPAGEDESQPKMIPEASAGFFSLLTFGWMSPILSLGYARPLQVNDLYELQNSRSASIIGNAIVESFERRRKVADEYNQRLINGDISPGWRSLFWTILGNKDEREKYWRMHSGQKKPSLIWAINDSVKWWFWSASILRVASDTLSITTPLLVQAIINFAQGSYNARSQGAPASPLKTGIGLAIGIFLMQLISSLCQHHFWYRVASTGILVRGGLIAAIYSRSFRLSSRARVTLSNGQLVTHIAADVSRIDSGCSLAHIAWTSMIQLMIALFILLTNLGPSALAGFSLFLMDIPVQSWIVKSSYNARTDSMFFTDKRVKLIQELLSGIRVIKFFAWEMPFLSTLAGIRSNEMRYVRKLLLIRAGNNSVATSFPILATVLSFICYSLSGHPLNPAIIFSSLTLFQLLRTPIMLLREFFKAFLRVFNCHLISYALFLLVLLKFAAVALSSVTDAYNATSRLYHVFVAETVEDDRITDAQAEAAIVVDHASFTWDVSANFGDGSIKANSKNKKSKKSKAKGKARDTTRDNMVFQIHDINLCIPRGQLCAIVGPVGSGKSSLLQGLIGEMRKTSGTVTFGGTVSYCPQSAWIQNATVRENICFGKTFESGRYWKAVHDSCLEADLALLSHGDLTEIGEKGISLSGGQKQRLNICRSIYADTDILIFDDPLSALDAHVGKDVFNNVLKSKGGKRTTRILVTHALHFLSQVDFIITLNNGQIAEQGTYDELLRNENGAFAKYVKEFEHGKIDEDSDGEDEDEFSPNTNAKPIPLTESNPADAALMQAEERAVGTVRGAVYTSYFSAANGRIIIPIIFVSFFLMQSMNVFSSYWLIYWEEKKWPEPQAFYIGIYSGLGLFQAAFSFVLGSLFAFQAYFASKELYRASLDRILHAPTAFFETTPLGRIMNRFSKDSVDNFLGDAWYAATSSLASILGAIILISAIFPWFLIPVVVLFTCYFYFSLFYRASARELNRLNAILRSTLVSHFSESLTGLSTIRAYGELDRFIKENEKRIDNENKAYWLTIANQRWLAIRLDAFGTFLIFVVALLSVLGRYIISPSQSGIMLSYILSIQSSLSLIVRQGATVEILMNSVERVVHYAKNIEQEKYKGDSDSQPPPTWPSKGSIEIKDLHLSYRPGLPPVLKGLNINLGAGEKLGIVGRTGAGKSSIMISLYRLVEPTSGSILIDGVEISKLDLEVLRRSISIIPQEAVLFPGTIRSNLDPFGQHDDSRLWDALQRSHLGHQSSKVDNPDLEEIPIGVTPAHTNRFSLDAIVDGDGSNFSMGERSLISLARALVKKSRILFLDEATASVDYETDRKIQDTIAHEFREQTILCIAHRLNTIIGYDRVCVMDAGRVAELDTPVNLFRQKGIFSGMCEQSGITLDDILFTQKARAMA